MIKQMATLLLEGKYKSKITIPFFGVVNWGRFHKPIYALRQALMLWAKLLHLKKASQKLGAECKLLA